jgi:YfiH family protein
LKSIESMSSELCGWITSPILGLDWLEHGFGLRYSPLPEGLTTVQQVHSARVLDAYGRRGEKVGEGDAIISAESQVAIGIRTADCVPILVADPRTRIVACVHAGWRGTAANIIGATIDALRSRGCRAVDLCVAIGPSIGSCCYEVGPEVAGCFEKWRPAVNIGGRSTLDLSSKRSTLDLSGKRSTLDLPGINQMQLLEAGVRQIWKSGECTFCQPDRFFSFRREREKAGRMISFVNRLT